MRIVGGLVAVALLTSSCGSGATDDASTAQLDATTSSSAARALDSPTDTSDDSPTLRTDVPGSEQPDTSSTPPSDEGTTSSESSSATTATTSTGPEPSSPPPLTAGSTTTTAETRSTTTTTRGASTTTTTTTTTTSTTQAPAPKPDRIELPQAVGSAEGIAVDSSTGRVFVSELNTGNVWVGRLDTDPYTLFASGSAAGRATALGMAADEQRRRLYVATPSTPRVDVLNLDSGDLITSIALPGGAGSTANDVTVAPDGTAYVSDIGKPHVYRIAAGDTTAELWVDYTATGAVDTSSRTQHGNGIVATSSYVLVAYMVGGELLRFDRSSGAVTLVPVSGAPTAGRDGLVLCGSRLYGVDIASFAGGTETVWITQLSGDGSSGTASGSIRSDSFSAATTAAPLNGSLMVVNAQFGVNPPQKPFWLSVVDAPC